MPRVKIDGKFVNIDPTVSELSTYQKHGLKPADRKPSDYLRMVARTFSSFRKTPAEDTVVSYIHGFEVTVNDEEIPTEVNWLITNHTYNIFKIRAGACMIDNQLIDIYEDSYFIFEESEFQAGLKYGIVIEYDYIEQRADNVARIRFIDYNSLHFPRSEDKSVVTCDYTDTSLDGINSTITFSGKPGLLIGTFKVANNVPNKYPIDQGKIIQSNPPIAGEHVYGIDPQYLSSLYIQNYKLLFEYFGDQSRAIYSSMGMTNANFFAVSKEQLFINGNVETDLRSGDMCYLDEDTQLYKRSEASQQHFSKVVGLYLNEYNEGNHLIYTSGVVTLNAAKHNLAADHTLLTLTTGSHYFLQDANTLFDSNNQTRTIDNYVLTDTSGRISSRYYPSAVRVGFATACNQLVLSIEHASEIQTNNLLSLFGTAEEYEREYTANDTVIDMDTTINSLNLRNQFIDSKSSNYKELLGLNADGSNKEDVNDISDFYRTKYAIGTDTTKIMIAMYKILPRWFANGTTAEAIWNTTITIDAVKDLEGIDPGKKSNLVADVTTKYKNFRNISIMLNNLNSIITNTLVKYEKYLSAYLSEYETRQLETYNQITIRELKIARYELGDKFGNSIEIFEDKSKKLDTAQFFTPQIVLLNKEIKDLKIVAKAQLDKYTSDVGYINSLKNMESSIKVYVDIMLNLISTMDKFIFKTSLEKISNENKIVENTTTRDNAAGNILNDDTLKLDIFLMDDHQRTIFNYTYITDRLRKRLSMVNTLSDDLLKAQTSYNTIINNNQSTIIDKITGLEEINRIENFIQSNNNLISNYTAEYNRIRVFTLGAAPIREGDLFFDELDHSNQKIGTYRYGCDDYEATYGSLSSNLISSPCGPYTSGTSVIIQKNDPEITIDVTPNIAHSSGLGVTLNNVSHPAHGTVRFTGDSIIYYHEIIEDMSNFVLMAKNGSIIQSVKTINSNQIIFNTTGKELAGYRIATSSTNTAKTASGYTKVIGPKLFYAVKPNYSGNDIIAYNIIDQNGQLATGTIKIVVTGPYTTPDKKTVVKNSGVNTLNVILNDGHTAAEKISLTADRTGLVEPLHGTLSIIAGNSSPAAYDTGTLTYSPNANFVGSDIMEYKIVDESGATAIGQLKVITI